MFNNLILFCKQFQYNFNLSHWITCNDRLIRETKKKLTHLRLVLHGKVLLPFHYLERAPCLFVKTYKRLIYSQNKGIMKHCNISSVSQNEIVFCHDIRSTKNLMFVAANSVEFNIHRCWSLRRCILWLVS